MPWRQLCLHLSLGSIQRLTKCRLLIRDLPAWDNTYEKTSFFYSRYFWWRLFLPVQKMREFCLKNICYYPILGREILNPPSPTQCFPIQVSEGCPSLHPGLNSYSSSFLRPEALGSRSPETDCSLPPPCGHGGSGSSETVLSPLSTLEIDCDTLEAGLSEVRGT